VYSGKPGTNYGAANRLRVRIGTYRSYLRFRVTGVTGEVTAVKLRLFVSDGSNAAGTAHRVASNSWGEGTIRWNNKPALGTALSKRKTVAAGTWVEFNLGTAITDNGTYSFAIAAGSADLVAFHSREGANDPRLVVTVQP
jgi:hypothetical protein